MEKSEGSTKLGEAGLGTNGQGHVLTSEAQRARTAGPVGDRAGRYVLPHPVVRCNRKRKGQALAVVYGWVSAGLDAMYLLSEALWVQGQ